MPEDRAAGVVGRGFGLERLGTQGDGDGVVDPIAAVLGQGRHRHAADHRGDQVGRDIAEELLLQGRRLEAGRDRTAQGERRREVITGRHLAGELVAEVGIVLVTAGQAEAELFGELAFQVDVGADVVAIDVDLVGRGKAGEALRARTAGGDGALVVGGGLACVDREILAPIRDADRHVQRLVQVDLDLFDRVDVDGQLAVAEATGLELTLGGRAVGGVEAVQDLVVDLVAAIAGRNVPVEAERRTLEAAVDVVVGDAGGDDRQEAVRIDGLDVVGVVERAGGGGGFRIAILITTEGIGFPAGRQRLAGVEIAGVGLGIGIAEAAQDGGRIAAVDGSRGGIVGAVGGLTTLGLARQGQEAVAEEGQTDPAGQGGLLAVRLRMLAAARGVFGVEHPVVQGQATAAVSLTQAQVDDAGDGVGTVLGRGAVTQDFHRAQGHRGDGVQVEGGGATAERAVDVDQGTDVAALAVDQDERLVGREATQGRRADVVGTVRDGRAGEAERRCGVGEGGGQFGTGAVAGQGLGLDHVDGRDGVEARTAHGAGAGDDDLFQGVGLIRLGRGLGGGDHGDGQKGAGRGERQKKGAGGTDVHGRLTDQMLSRRRMATGPIAGFLNCRRRSPVSSPWPIFGGERQNLARTGPHAALACKLGPRRGSVKDGFRAWRSFVVNLT